MIHPKFKMGQKTRPSGAPEKIGIVFDMEFAGFPGEWRYRLVRLVNGAPLMSGWYPEGQLASVGPGLSEMGKQQKIDQANALHTVNQLAKMSAERDALAAKCHCLIGVLMQMRDRWWPFVHGAVGASEAARGLLKKSADVIEAAPELCLKTQLSDAFKAGFSASREGFNGQVEHQHLAPEAKGPHQLADEYAESVREAV